MSYIGVGVGFWNRIRELAEVGRPIESIMPDLDAETITVTYSSGPDNTYTFVQVVAWLDANIADLEPKPRHVSDPNPANRVPLPGSLIDDLREAMDAWLRWSSKTDGTPPPEYGWTTETMPGRGGRT